MKKLLAIFIAIILFVPSFVEGGKNMANPTYTVETDYMTDLNKVAGGIDYTDSSGRRRHWDSHSSSSSSINDLYAAQLKAMTAALQKQRASALSSLAGEQTALTTDYYGKRNQAGAQSDIGKMNFANFMASRGVAGNAGAMPEIYANNALQSQIGALNQQEAAGNAQIEAAKTNVESAYQSDLTAAKNRVASEQLQAELEQQRADQAAALEQQRYDAQAAERADSTTYNRLQDTKSEYGQNIGQFAANFLAEYNKVKNDGDPSNDWQLAPLMAAREEKMQSEQVTKEAQQKEIVNNALQIFSQLGYLTPEMKAILSQYGLPTDVYTLNKIKSQKSGSSNGTNGSSGYGLNW